MMEELEEFIILVNQKQKQNRGKYEGRDKEKLLLKLNLALILSVEKPLAFSVCNTEFLLTVHCETNFSIKNVNLMSQLIFLHTKVTWTVNKFKEHSKWMEHYW